MPAKKRRVIQVFINLNATRARLIGVREASSLKQGLLDYYKETLQPMGYEKPIVRGNVLTVTMKGVQDTYFAKDVS